MRGKVVFLFLVAALWLAGCSGSAGPNAAGGDASSSMTATGEPVPDAGSIVGTVVDESAVPLEGAQVAIVAQHLEATTDASGAFQFGNLAPGSYRVEALQLGFANGARQVDVPASGEARVTFILTAVVIETIRHETIGPYAGFFGCQMGAIPYAWECGRTDVTPPTALSANDKRFLDFNMTADNWAMFVGEMKWTPAAAATSPKLDSFFSFQKRTGGHWWCDVDGPSPTQWRYAKDESLSKCGSHGSVSTPAQPTTKIPLRMAATVPFTCTSCSPPEPVYISYNQHFEMMMTIFYGEPAPAGYTAFKDG